MPTLRLYNISKESAMSAAPCLLSSLSSIYCLPEDYINLEVVLSVSVNKSGGWSGLPMIEIVSFKRELEVEDSVAESINAIFKTEGYQEIEIYYHYVEARNYYCDGKHL